MRTLKFIVKDQTIQQDPECDFSGLVPGSDGHISAEFSFSEEWTGCLKIVGFSSGNKEYTPQVLNASNICEIPYKALERNMFRIQVFGKKANLKLITNKIIIKQGG